MTLQNSQLVSNHQDTDYLLSPLNRLVALPVITTPLPTRFLTKFVTDPETGCWNWTGSKKTSKYKDKVYAYGAYFVDGTPTTASRFSYEAHYGPLPDHLEVDHLCLNKLCVNPHHLEAVTHQENCRRRSKSGPYPTPGSTRERRGVYAGRY